MTMIGISVSRESIHKALDKAFEANISEMFDQLFFNVEEGDKAAAAGMFDRGLKNAITAYEIASKVVAARTDVA